jgi:hypothetical protein
MARKVHYNHSYSGRKLGNIVVSYSPKTSCPDTCSLKSGGCYAWDLYYMRIMGDKIESGKQKVKGVIKDFNIRSLADALKNRAASCKIVRHRVAGDILGDVENTVEDCKTIEKEGLTNIGYTHAWREPYAQPLKNYFRASCQTMEEVKEARAMGWSPTVIFTESIGKGKQEIDGDTVVMCPIDDYKKSVTCNSCRLCRVDEKTKDITIGFKIHGNGAKKNKHKVQGIK